MPLFPLLFLPAPLLIDIARQLDPQDIFHLRLTCGDIGALLRPLTFRTLDIALVPRSIQMSFEKLQSIVEGTCPGPLWIKTLKLGYFNPKYEPRPSAGPRNRDNRYPANAKDYSELVQKAVQLLPHAVAMLQSLEAIRWWFRGPGLLGQPRLDTLLNVLDSLPSLRSLRLIMPRNCPPIHLKIRSLEYVSLLVVPQPDQNPSLGRISHQIHLIVQNAPRLQILEFSEINPPSDARCLNDLAPSSSASGVTEPYNIQHIRLTGMGVGGLTITSPIGISLANLRSLTLHHITARNKMSTTNLVQNIDQFWQQWNHQATGIFLEELDINYIPPPPLIQYLSSYSGLCKLRIVNFQLGTRVDIDPYVFWTDGLQKHSRTLESLYLCDYSRTLMYEGSSSISTLTALRDLTLPVRLTIPFDPEHRNVALMMDLRLTQLIGYSTSKLAQLQTLRITIPSTNVGRHAMPDPDIHKAWMLKEVGATVERCLQVPAPRRVFSHRVEAMSSGSVGLVCFLENSPIGRQDDPGQQIS